MTTIVELDHTLVDMFQSVLGDSALAVESLDLLRRRLDEYPQEYAVVLGPSVDLSAAATFAESMRLARPTLSVILVRKRVDAAILGEALRSGMREVVEERDLTRLGEGVHRAYALWQALTETDGGSTATKRGHVFTVFSNKGGVGKSTLATNLAVAFSDDEDTRVCLVDLDVVSGDVAIMLQLLPTTSLADLTSMQHSLDPHAVESLLTPHSPRLSVLAAPVSPDASAMVSSDAVGRILQMLATMFDVVVVDTSGGFDDFALQAFDHSDLLLLMGTLDIPALKSLKLATETLDLLNFPGARRRLVLNRADSKVGLDPQEVEKTLQMSITAAIPSSRDVPASINRGQAIVRAEPRHPVTHSIRTLAQHLLTSVRTELPVVDAAEPEPRRRLLRRKVR
ncbi:MAG: P-loop NTPase [Propionibacteriales bacterium]|nr:P-loop NTPase [Propionibacteriales bacterium]